VSPQYPVTRLLLQTGCTQLKSHTEPNPIPYTLIVRAAQPSVPRQWTATTAVSEAPTAAPSAALGERGASPASGGGMSPAEAHAAAQLPLIDLGSSPEGTLGALLPCIVLPAKCLFHF